VQRDSGPAVGGTVAVTGRQHGQAADRPRQGARRRAPADRAPPRSAISASDHGRLRYPGRGPNREREASERRSGRGCRRERDGRCSAGARRAWGRRPRAEGSGRSRVERRGGVRRGRRVGRLGAGRGRRREGEGCGRDGSMATT
jgi:hypothetical protein